MSELKRLPPIADRISDKMLHNELIELVDNKVISYEVDGKVISVSLEDNEVIDYVLMSDQYFYQNWLTQFAIGRVGGKNYFDMNGWSEITDKFTKGVMVVHEETKEFLFIIPKLIEPQYSESTRSTLSRLAGLAGQSKFQDQTQRAKTLTTFAKLFTETAKADSTEVGITQLIPDRIYKMFKVNPNVLKDVIYIRDYFKTITPGDQKSKKLTEIITKNYEGGKLTQTEKDFVQSLTDNRYVFAEETISEDKQSVDKSSAIKDGIPDPFAD